MKEKSYILAVRCSELEFSSVDSVKGKCIECGEEVWVGKALQKQKVTGVICNVCIPKIKKPEYILKPEVVEEVLEHMAREDNYAS